VKYGLTPENHKYVASGEKKTAYTLKERKGWSRGEGGTQSLKVGSLFGIEPRVDLYLETEEVGSEKKRKLQTTSLHVGQEKI